MDITTRQSLLPPQAARLQKKKGQNEWGNLDASSSSLAPLRDKRTFNTLHLELMGPATAWAECMRRALRKEGEQEPAPLGRGVQNQSERCKAASENCCDKIRGHGGYEDYREALTGLMEEVD